ncbi:hypothetical protein ACFYWU_37445 [Streptomyces chrestomyceticus]|uniref:hypothetical protein n=1 Tax=Streptomyces chrestomyceticus TaxID=68185 RepID=UPI00369709EE
MTYRRPLSDRPKYTALRPGAATAAEEPLRGPGHAEVRIVAASPEAARLVAQTLRDHYAAAEQRSYPADAPDGGTRLHLTVDTTRTPGAVESPRPWPVAGRPHHDELANAASRRSAPTTPEKPSGDRPTS